MSAARRLAWVAGGAVLGSALWWRANPSACPYGQRFWVEAPHPLITRERLRAVLAPVPGERVLEVGPGTGYYSLDVAEWVSPVGRLERAHSATSPASSARSDYPPSIVAASARRSSGSATTPTAIVATAVAARAPPSGSDRRTGDIGASSSACRTVGAITRR